MDEYKQSPRFNDVTGNVTYNQHEHHYPAGTPAPRQAPRPGRWAWLGGLVAVLALGGGVATTQLSAKVYYCASHHSGVKYHTDATCVWLTQCGAKIKSIPLSRARGKMDLCKACH